MPKVDIGYALGLPPEKALEYFRSKGYKLSGNWREMDAAAHQKAFTVANVMKLDILQDLRGEVDKYIAGGKLSDAQKTLQTILEKKGWWSADGKGLVTDADGVVLGKKLNARRVNTILKQNKIVAFATARHDKMLKSVDRRPYWRYCTRLDGRVRPAHAAMEGLVYRFDDGFWDSFYPPNGWLCRCYVTCHSERDIEREGWGDAMRDTAQDDSLSTWTRETKRRDGTIAKDEVTTYTDPKRRGADGKPVKITPDVGWNHNPARDWTRAFTPAPLDTLPKTFDTKYLKLDLPELTRTQKVSAKDILKDDLTEVEFAQAFLSEFGATIEKGVMYNDVVGAQLPINVNLFVDKATGELKANKQGRGPYLKLMAQTIKTPDEIWHNWQEQGDGVWRIKRRYIKAFEFVESGKKMFGLGVFELGDDGWTGSTVFSSKVNRSYAQQLKYINEQRAGMLMYRADEQ